MQNKEIKEAQALSSILYLYFHSDLHRSMTFERAKTALLPPIRLGFYTVFFTFERPSSALTWAFFSADAEQRFVNNEPIVPADWRSGKRLWITEVVAPFSSAALLRTARWFRSSLRPETTRVRYLRVDGDFEVRKVVEYNRRGGDVWRPRVIDPNDIPPHD